MPNELRNHETPEDDRRVKIHCLRKISPRSKCRQWVTIERTARNVVSYVNLHGDFVIEATALVDGALVLIHSYGIACRRFTIAKD